MKTMLSIICVGLLLADVASARAPRRRPGPRPKVGPRPSYCAGLDRVQCLINVRLVHQLQNGQPDVRQRAAETLERRGPGARPTLAALEHALRHEREAHVRLAVARALSAVGPAPNSSPLVLTGALSDPEPQIRLLACEMLKVLRTAGRMAENALRTTLLRDSNEQVRTCAIVALNLVGAAPRPSIEALEKALLNDRSSRVKTAAMEALEKFDRSVTTSMPILEKALCRKDPELRQAAVAFLVKLGARAVPVLSRGVKHTNSQCREAAVQALARLKPFPSPALPSLRLSLADKDPHVRRAAAAAIGMVGRPAAPIMGHLRDLLLEDKEPMVRAAAATSLGQLGQLGRLGGGALQALKKAAIDSDPAVRDAASKALDQVLR